MDTRRAFGFSSSLFSLCFGYNVAKAEIFYVDPLATNAMFIACDALLSGNFREISVVSCSREMSSEISQRSITQGKNFCFPYKVTPEMRAYVFVRYVQREYWKLPEAERQKFLQNSWIETARKAYEEAWRCL